MNRLSFVLASLSLAACGGGGGTEVITPTGPHTQYVISKANVPTTAAQVMDFGLDLGSSKSNSPDGTVDNALGTTLQTLTTLKFPVQDGIDTAVQDGSIILLADVQTESFDSSNAAGIKVLLGANPTPPACDTATPPVCGGHLKGNGTFTIAANSPQDAALAGKIANGTLEAGPGDVTLQIALGGTMPITLGLHNARAEVSGITATSIMTAKIGGMISQSDINTGVLPAVQSQLPPLIARDCPAATMANMCMCTSATSTGAQILSLLDANKDCMVTVEEIQNNSTIKSLLGPDVCIEDSCEKPDALSIGIEVTAVAATFPAQD